MKITKRILLILSVVALLVGCFAFMASAAEGDLVATFEFGENEKESTGSEDGKDGSNATTYTETAGGYILNITGGTNMYKGSYDALGNACLKLGTSKNAGSFSFTVPDDVTSVVIYVAGYKSNAATVNINGTEKVLEGRSASGTYDAIEVDTSITKTVTLTTTSSGKRAKVNTIEFYKKAVECDCSAETLAFVEAKEATCYAEGNREYYQCSVCGKYYSDAAATEEIAKADTIIAKTAAHTDANNDYACDVEACKAPVAPEADTTLTIEQANMLGKVHGHQQYTEGKYYVTGKVTEVYNTQYGNMYIEDAEGNKFTIYGTYSADGSARYDAMDVKPVAGDTVTVYGVIGAYSGKAQMKDGWLTAHEVAPCDHADNDGDYQCDSCGVAVAPEADTTLTLEQANKLGLLTTTTGKYYVTGVITEVKSTTYGNIYIEDENGTQFYIYGTYSADGNTRYDAMDVKPVVGDTITVYGIITSYKGAAQMEDGWITEHTVPEVEPMDYTFVVPYGCEAPKSGSATEVQLPKAPDVKFGNGKYTFVGWSTASVENTTTAPEELYEEADVYTLTENTTFYAVYSYEKSVNVYQKVTEAPADWSGTYLIVCEAGNFVFDGSLTELDAASNKINVTIDNGQIVPTDNINNCRFEIAEVEGGYTIKSSSGMYIGQTSDANGLKSSSSTQYVNTITLNGEDVNIVSGGAYLRFNAASNQMRFRYYKSSSYTGQKAIQLYKFVDTQTFYTSFEADFYSANVRLEESLLVNYYVALNTSYDVENLKMVFTMNDEATEMLAGVVAEDGRLVFTFDGIAPQYMGANIKAELYNGDAVIKSMDEYSVKTNLEAIRPEDETSELAKLIDATLAYGAAAQNYTNTDTENLVGNLENLGTVAEDGAVSNATYAQDGYVIGAGVFFDGLNRVAIFVDKNDVTITCTVGGEAVEVSELVYSSAAKMYYVLLEPVYASGLEDVYTITVTNNAGAVATIEYNVHAYCYAHQNDEDVDTKNLAVAYYNYGVASLAYNN